MIHLTRAERYILRQLIHDKGKTVPIRELIPPPTWLNANPHPRNRRNTLRVLLYNLRQKLPPGKIQTVPGGMRWAP